MSDAREWDELQDVDEDLDLDEDLGGPLDNHGLLDFEPSDRAAFADNDAEASAELHAFDFLDAAPLSDLADDDQRTYDLEPDELGEDLEPDELDELDEAEANPDLEDLDDPVDRVTVVGDSSAFDAPQDLAMPRQLHYPRPRDPDATAYEEAARRLGRDVDEVLDETKRDREQLVQLEATPANLAALARGAARGTGPTTAQLDAIEGLLDLGRRLASRARAAHGDAQLAAIDALRALAGQLADALTW
jgi:hypothetical protein